MLNTISNLIWERNPCTVRTYIRNSFSNCENCQQHYLRIEVTPNAWNSFYYTIKQ